MQFQLKQFNDVRYSRCVEAAQLEVTEDDGKTSILLWMSRDHIEKNVCDFGPHPDLLLAYKLYGRPPEMLVDMWRSHGSGKWLRPCEPARCSLGYYAHVDYPGHLTDEAFSRWTQLTGLEFAAAWMESDPDAEELMRRYGAGDNDILAWEPAKPEGDGWFVGSIHESDDGGPVCVWLRHKGAQA
ncbi:hypothetical protein PEp14_00041 [Erwinia phage PEp14]|uniref:Uncharacterized protein n=1 Tax=Erwinia phage PEp14 TaxID=1131315 RepID=H2DE71_9CAUD|nr:hypothetical protein PEp14_00041 [Erwinia phage PEp14]AEY69630.1 hypothetical protein PEp14_00041 [Erwinia phage PEp14]